MNPVDLAKDMGKVTILRTLLLLLMILPWGESVHGKALVEVKSLRFWSNPGYTRVVLDLSREAEYRFATLPPEPKEGVGPRVYVDISGSQRGRGLDRLLEIDDGLLRRVRTGAPAPGKTRVVLDLVGKADFKVFHLEDPYRIIIDVGGERQPVISSNPPELRSLPPGRDDGIAGLLDKAPRDEPPSLHLPKDKGKGGLRRIVVDAGHGGKDPGAVGPNGVLEKDVTLAMAKRLKKHLEKDLGCEVILTRDRDVFLPLEERTAIANKVGADLFISLHANASPHRTAYGTETYYLNLAKNEQAAAVAARENGTTLKEVSDLEAILFDLMANSKINESGRLAAEIQKSLVDQLSRKYSNVKDLGVRQGPFYVLLGATMPSVLVEAAFISHRREEARLTDGNFQDHTARAISRAVRNYGVALNLLARR